jgi:hypothetical protein
MRTQLALLAVTAAGFAAALTLTAHPARAWDWTSLPNGYNVRVTNYPNASGDGSTCHKVSVDGHAMGDDCVDNAGMYAAIDAYIDSTICTVNPAAGGSRCVTTTSSTAPATTTAASTTTTTSTSSTTTQSQSEAPAQGAAAATTEQAPAPPAATTTVVVTTTTPADVQDLTARLDKLAAELAALTTRLDRVEAAGNAAWVAFLQAVNNGDDQATAATVARGTYLNAIYALGAFAP